MNIARAKKKNVVDITKRGFANRVFVGLTKRFAKEQYI